MCGLTLVSSPHLARSYHHLFPVPPFEEVSAEELARLQKELNRAAPGPKPKLSLTPQQIEEVRMDAVAKHINDHLRQREEPRRVHHLDPAAPHPMLHRPNTTGLSR